MYTLCISEDPAHTASCQKGPEISTLLVFLVCIKQASERWNVTAHGEIKSGCFSFRIKKCLRCGEHDCMETKHLFSPRASQLKCSIFSHSVISKHSPQFKEGTLTHTHTHTLTEDCTVWTVLFTLYYGRLVHMKGNTVLTWVTDADEVHDDEKST